MPTADVPQERRGPGRPRKWATEAERVRAYRQRKAEEHANVDELRVERRTLKRQLSDALRERQRAEAALEHAAKRAVGLEADLERAREQLHEAHQEIGWLRSTNEQLVAERNSETVNATREPSLSREQRRAMERNRRKRGR